MRSFTSRHKFIIFTALAICSALCIVDPIHAQQSPATDASAPNVRFVEQGGIRYQETRTMVNQPVRDFRYVDMPQTCLLYTSPSPRDKRQSRMPSSA